MHLFPRSKPIQSSPLLALAVYLFVGVSQPVLADTRVIDIADGDYAALQSALCGAALQDEDRTVIHLAERGYYPVSRQVGSLPPLWRACQYGGRAGIIPISPGANSISGHVVIKGRNAILDFEGAQGFVVTEVGQLELEAVELKASPQPLVVNGRAALRRVSLIESEAVFPEQRAPVHNRGYLELRSTLIAANRLSQVPADLLVANLDLNQCPDTGSAGILNEGMLVANNVTLFDNHWEIVDLPAAPTGACVTRDLVNLPGAEARFGNSLLSSGLFATCVGMVDSLGYNSVPEGGACGFDGPGDLVVFSEGVFPYVPHDPARQLGRALFLPDGERLAAGSPEALGASDSACEKLDVRGYLRGAHASHCLRGALELDGHPALDSGIDGLWGDPDNDGQYLQVSHYGRNRILLTWYGFDPRGEQMWVYASPVYQGGNRASAQAWRNTGVRLVDGRLEGDIEAVPWGEVTVEAQACDRLKLGFVAQDPEIGSFEHRLTRLTDNAAAACSE